MIEEDEQHARKVLRLAQGDELEGLDGQGQAWPLRVAGHDEGGLLMEVVGPVHQAPRPGSERAQLPDLHLAIAWPKGKRGDALLSAAVGLGVSRITPVTCQHSPPSAARGSARPRLERLVREGCKLSRRLWFPVLDDASAFESMLQVPAASELLLLDAGAEQSLSTAVLEAAQNDRRALRLLIGPQGGFCDEERELARARGALEVGLGPHVLRIEHAAIAAVAIAMHTYWAQRSQ